MGMVDLQSCSVGNRTGSDGTDEEKEREPTSLEFGNRRVTSFEVRRPV